MCRSSNPAIRRCRAGSDLARTTRAHAAFLSPQLAHARRAGEPLKRAAIATSHGYDSVRVMAADAAGADAFERLLVDLTRGGRVAVEVIDGGGDG